MSDMRESALMNALTNLVPLQCRLGNTLARVRVRGSCLAVQEIKSQCLKLFSTSDGARLRAEIEVSLCHEYSTAKVSCHSAITLGNIRRFGRGLSGGLVGITDSADSNGLLPKPDGVHRYVGGLLPCQLHISLPSFPCAMHLPHLRTCSIAISSYVAVR